MPQVADSGSCAQVLLSPVHPRAAHLTRRTVATFHREQSLCPRVPWSLCLQLLCGLREAAPRPMETYAVPTKCPDGAPRLGKMVQAGLWALQKSSWSPPGQGVVALSQPTPTQG